MTDLKRTLTEVDGVKVIATEPAIGPHPRWPSRLVERTGISKVLLENGGELFVCNEGDYAANTIVSVVSHRNGTHRRKAPHQLYPAETIRTVVREHTRSRLMGIRGSLERTAAWLNENNVPTVKGMPWTGGAVSHIFHKYEDRYRGAVAEAKKRHPAVRRGGMGKTTEAVTPIRAKERPGRHALKIAQLDDSTVFELIERLGDQLDDAQIMLDRLAKKARELTVVVDPEVVEKARKWDDMRKLMQ